MKWINLSDRQPEKFTTQTVLRLTEFIGSGGWNLPMEKGFSINLLNIKGIDINNHKIYLHLSPDGVNDFEIPFSKLEWLDESEEIVTSPFSDDFAGTNKRLKDIWHLDSVTRDGQMEADFQKELPFIVEYYRHQYLYWKNKLK